MGNNKNDRYLGDDVKTLDLLSEKYPGEQHKKTKKKLLVFSAFLGVGCIVYPHPVLVVADLIVSLFKGLN